MIVAGVFRTAALASLFFLAACSGAANDRATTRPAPTLTPIPRYHASAAQLAGLRQKWQTAQSGVLVPGDSLRGQILELLDSPDMNRGYFIVQDAPNRADVIHALPRRWETTHELIGNAIDAVTTARDDLEKWEHGADLDDDLKGSLKDDTKAIVATMCDATQDARAYYTAAGGYPDDISLLIMSDKGDPPCANYSMAHPYKTSTLRQSLVTIAETSGEVEGVNAQAYLDDHTGFVIDAGTPVEVIAHRWVDSEEITMCRVRGGGGTGWLDCAKLARRPERADG